MMHQALYINETPKKGRGVFTQEALPAKTVIEIVPVIVIPFKDRKHIEKTVLYNYVFEWQEAGDIIMALGYVPLYNHSFKSNCHYEMDYDAGTISVMTIKNIAAGKELTLNYNGKPGDDTPLWFPTID